MTIDQFLTDNQDVILAQANAALARAELRHYEDAGPQTTAVRLQTLYTLMIDALRERDLAAIVRYAEDLAAARYAAGYDLLEVQTAFNALEEAIWQRLLEDYPRDDLSMALGLTSKVHGAGKDALARQYVRLAGGAPAARPDIDALFAGTDGV